MSREGIHYIKASDLGDIIYLRDKISGRLVGAINKKKARCHPTEKHYALGLCRKCYEKQLREKNPEFKKRQLENRQKWGGENQGRVKQLNQSYQERRNTDPVLRKRDRVNKRKKSLQKNYGLTLKDYEQMLETQNNRCAICSIRHTENKKLQVDHNHLTGKVRGLLCKSCNFLVGTFESRLALLMQAGRYLYNADSGGVKHDSKKLLFSAIPPYALQELANVFTIGAAKYGIDNWRDGLLWGKVFSAMQRHAWAFWGGEELDPEDGQHHLASVAWGALTLLDYTMSHPELDDRMYKKKESKCQ